jgi:hypothetical protein
MFQPKESSIVLSELADDSIVSQGSKKIKHIQLLRDSFKGDTAANAI